MRGRAGGSKERSESPAREPNLFLKKPCSRDSVAAKMLPKATDAGLKCVLNSVQWVRFDELTHTEICSKSMFKRG